MAEQTRSVQPGSPARGPASTGRLVAILLTVAFVGLLVFDRPSSMAQDEGEDSDFSGTAFLSGMDRSILVRMRELTREAVKAAVGDHLTDIEIDAMLSRRDRIVAHYDQAKPGLLFDRRPRS